MQKIICLMALVTHLTQQVHAAGPVSGAYFANKDWELACDNTRTCRAAGYQAENGVDNPISVLLTRAAGSGQAVNAQVLLGDYDDSSDGIQLPDGSQLTMHINARPLGTVAVNKNSLLADLKAEQVDALLAALSRSSRIDFSVAGHRWTLSDQGAASVLLKMDELQGRVGTVSALIKKGRRSEASVLPALPAPIVIAPALPPTRPADHEIVKKHAKTLNDELRKTIMKENHCPELTEPEGSLTELLAERLSATQLLVSRSCWLAAYQGGAGYWVTADKPPFQPVLVTTSATDATEGRIEAMLKGRGLGDCWSSRTWTWDGQHFVPTHISTTGLCRLVAAGGAWTLPTLTTEVRTANPQ